jgi:DNA-binding transcriptional regulator YiaG
MAPMGAANRYPRPVLTDGERAQLALGALTDGTAARIRDLRGWSADEMARHCNVSTYLLRDWETGAEVPSLASALKVWQVLVGACVDPP